MPSGPSTGTPATTMINLVSTVRGAGSAVAIGDCPKNPVRSSPGSPAGSAPSGRSPSPPS